MKRNVDLKKLFCHAIDVHIYQYLPEKYKIKTYTGDSGFEIAFKNNFPLDQFIQNYIDYQKNYFAHQKIKKVSSKVCKTFDFYVLYKLADSLLKNYFKRIDLNPHLSIEKLAHDLNTHIFTEDIESELLLFGRGYEQRLIELEKNRLKLNKKRSEARLNQHDKNEHIYISIIRIMQTMNLNLKRASDAITEKLLREKKINKFLSSSYQTQIINWAKKQITRNTSNKDLAITLFKLHNPQLLKSLVK